jgi:hypothetical protein
MAAAVKTKKTALTIAVQVAHVVTTDAHQRFPPLAFCPHLQLQCAPRPWRAAVVCPTFVPPCRPVENGGRAKPFSQMLRSLDPLVRRCLGLCSTELVEG